MIRLAVAADYPAICAYLEAHWRKGHIFTTHKALFDWQHWDAARQRYNFILGCAPNGDIQGVLGFIPHGQFDPALGFDSIWLCIWHASVKGTGLGRRMLDWLEETFKPTFLGTNGASEMSLPLYQARGWETGKLEHWYMTWPFDGRLTEADSHESPRKSPIYARCRYDAHPFYKYKRVGGVVMRGCRSVTAVGLRVVDVMGDQRGMHLIDWPAAAADHGASYIDFYCAGFNGHGLEAIGFKRRIADEVIIPNHFEPYEHRNVDILYAVKAPKGMPFRLTRGDGDMDRPNVLPC